MGISYDGVGGIGIELTEEIIQKLIAANIFTEEEWEEDSYECLDKLDFDHGTAGNLMRDEGDHFIFVEGDNLKEIIENYPTFLDKLKSFGVELSIEDLLVISEYRIS